MKIAELGFGVLSVLVSMGVFLVLMLGVLPVLGLSAISGTTQDGATQTVIQYHGIMWRNAGIAAAVSALVGTVLAVQVRDVIVGLFTARARGAELRRVHREAERAMGR